jgi:spore coat polysaccharide biosynthesis protein SpsF (cytidylyltransferase family)
MKIIAITQARYGSTRLPAKILKKVGNKTLLEIHLERILNSKRISKLIVATTNEEGASNITNIAQKLNLDFYKGSINDVLDRFYNAAVNENPDFVVRITSDCPLIDSILMDEIIDVCLKGDYDYVSNTIEPTFPDGTDVEVFKFSALKRAFTEADLKSDREHVTPYIWKNSTAKGGFLFKSLNFSNQIDYSNYRITVDTIEDFNLIEKLILKLGFDKSWKDYIDYLEINPELLKINLQNKRNEGYQKSLLND